MQGQLWFNQQSPTTGKLYVRTSTQGTGGNILNWNQIIVADNAHNVTLPGNLVTSGTITGVITGSAASITGGTAGSIPYQTGPSSTSFTTAGVSSQVLTSTGGSAPAWVSQSTLNVNSAISATSLSGGFAGDVVYQSSTGVTAFIGAGTSGQLLQSNGAAAPSWISPASFGVSSFNTRIGAVTLSSADVSIALGYTPPTPTGSGASGTWPISITGTAPNATNVTGTIASGVTATTQATGTNNTTVATTAFVHNSVAAAAGSAWFSVWNTTGGGMSNATGTINFISSNGAVGCSYAGGTVTVTVASGTQVWALQAAVTWAKNEDGNASNIVNYLQHNGGNIANASVTVDPNIVAAIPATCSAVIAIGAGTHTFRYQCTTNDHSNLQGGGSFSGYRIA